MTKLMRCFGPAPSHLPNGQALAEEVEQGKRTLTFSDQEYDAYLRHRYPREVTFHRAKDLACTALSLFMGLLCLQVPQWMNASEKQDLVGGAALVIMSLVLALVAPHAPFRWALTAAMAFPAWELLSPMAGGGIGLAWQGPPGLLAVCLRYLLLALVAMAGGGMGAYLRADK